MNLIDVLYGQGTLKYQHKIDFLSLSKVVQTFLTETSDFCSHSLITLQKANQ